MCCHRLLASADACDGLGQSPKGGPSTESSIGLAGGAEEDRFEGTSANHTSSEEGQLIL